MKTLKIIIGTTLFMLVLLAIGKGIEFVFDIDWKWVFVFYLAIFTAHFIEQDVTK